MDLRECPCCGEETYHFSAGAYEAEHRFGKVEPDEGWCENCDFRYLEHINHPESEQIEKHEKKLLSAGWVIDYEQEKWIAPKGAGE